MRIMLRHRCSLDLMNRGETNKERVDWRVEQRKARETNLSDCVIRGEKQTTAANSGQAAWGRRNVHG